MTMTKLQLERFKQDVEELFYVQRKNLKRDKIMLRITGKKILTIKKGFHEQELHLECGGICAMKTISEVLEKIKIKGDY